MLKTFNKQGRNRITMFFGFLSIYASQLSAHIPDPLVLRAKLFMLWHPFKLPLIYQHSHSGRYTHRPCLSAHMASYSSSPHLWVSPLPTHAHMLWMTTLIHHLGLGLILNLTFLRNVFCSTQNWLKCPPVWFYHILCIPTSSACYFLSISPSIL